MLSIATGAFHHQPYRAILITRFSPQGFLHPCLICSPYDLPFLHLPPRDMQSPNRSLLSHFPSQSPTPFLLAPDSSSSYPQASYSEKHHQDPLNSSSLSQDTTTKRWVQKLGTKTGFNTAQIVFSLYPEFAVVVGVTYTVDKIGKPLLRDAERDPFVACAEGHTFAGAHPGYGEDTPEDIEEEAGEDD